MTANGKQHRRVAVQPSAGAKVLGAAWRHPANRGNRAGAIARILRFQAVARLTGQPTVVPFAESSRVFARHDGAGSKRAAYAPIPDWNEMRVWQRHLVQGDLFIDVGANVGLYTVLAAELGCEVIAIEPLPETSRQLRENLGLNSYSAEVVEGALGAECGTMNIAGPDALRQHLVPGSRPGGRPVPVSTLDAIIGDRIAAGVKVDVEGAERQVLEGGRRSLEERRIRLLQLEWNDTAELNFGEDRVPVAEMLSTLGYEVCRADEMGELSPTTDLSLGPDVFARPR